MYTTLVTEHNWMIYYYINYTKARQEVSRAKGRAKVDLPLALYIMAKAELLPHLHANLISGTSK